MNEADEFLDRVDGQLWAVKRTPNDGGPSLYLKPDTSEPGGYEYVSEPVWMPYAEATAYIRDTRMFMRSYVVELIPQMQMKK